MPQFGYCPAFDLSHPFASEVEDLSYIGKRAGLTPVESKSHHQHLPLALLQDTESVDEVEAAHHGRRVPERVGGGLVFYEILKLGVALFADGAVQRHCVGWGRQGGLHSFDVESAGIGNLSVGGLPVEFFGQSQNFTFRPPEIPETTAS